MFAYLYFIHAPSDDSFVYPLRPGPRGWRDAVKAARHNLRNSILLSAKSDVLAAPDSDCRLEVHCSEAALSAIISSDEFQKYAVDACADGGGPVFRSHDGVFLTGDASPFMGIPVRRLAAPVELSPGPIPGRRSVI